MHRQLLGTAAGLALLAAPAFAQDAAPAGAEGTAAAGACAPTVTVTQMPPEVRITLPEDPAADPVVTVVQAPPEVVVEDCPADAEAGTAAPETQVVVNAAETAELVVTRQAAGEAAA
jgi:hypothetical protein